MYDEFYNHLAKEHGEDNELHCIDKYRMRVFAKIINKSDIKVLDVGSRNAWLKNELHLNKNNVDYTCLDISEHYVKLMKCNNVNAHLGDICKKTKFKKESFDIIILGEILEHLPNTGLALEECNRLLKKNGKIIGTVPNVWNIGNFVRVLFRKDTEPSGQHIHFFDKYHLRNLFKIQGFKDINVWSEPFSYSLCKFKKTNLLLSKITGLSTNIFFEVKKK